MTYEPISKSAFSYWFNNIGSNSSATWNSYNTTIRYSKYNVYECTSNRFNEKIENIKDGDLPEMNITYEQVPLTKDCTYKITCYNSKDLFQENILRNLSIMKSRLQMECAPVRLRRIECKMTPDVKKNIIQAYRRVNMFGKKTPFIARFDEYGKRLEDDVKITTLEGMKISIVDPKDYGPLYLEFNGIVDAMTYAVEKDKKPVDD